MVRNFEITLREMAAPSGEISLADLTAVAGRLQDLSTRVSRWVANIDGSGRSPAAVADVAALRFAGVRPGSTILEIRGGSPWALDVETPFDVEVSSRFWVILEALGTDTPPEDTPSNVRESAGQLLDALDHAAPLVAVTRDDGAQVEFRPAERDREVWRADAGDDVEDLVTVVGTLEAVDLRTDRFRIVDDVGNRIRLDEVTDAPAAGRLVGRRVAARGSAKRERGGGPRAVSSAVVTSVPLSDSFFEHQDPSGWSPPLDGPGPDPDGAIELNDDEWAEFLAVIHGR